MKAIQGAKYIIATVYGKLKWKLDHTNEVICTKGPGPNVASKNYSIPGQTTVPTLCNTKFQHQLMLQSLLHFAYKLPGFFNFKS